MVRWRMVYWRVAKVRVRCPESYCDIDDFVKKKNGKRPFFAEVYYDENGPIGFTGLSIFRPSDLLVVMKSWRDLIRKPTLEWPRDFAIGRQE